MKVIAIIALLVTLSACRGVGYNSDRDKRLANEHSVMGPAYDVYYPDKGTSFEVGGSVSIDYYTIRRKSKGQ